jgi:hypothetical protein
MDAPGGAGGLQSEAALPLVASWSLEKTGIRSPTAEDPRELVSEIAGELAPGASTAVSLAITPLAIVFVFAPMARH